MTSIMRKKPPEDVDLLRYAQRLFDDCTETFNQSYSSVELLQIARCHSVSEWDIYPDDWAQWQVGQALEGLVPHWNEDEEPCPSVQRIGDLP